VSDPSFDNPIFWNFGKVDLKFSKPKDPSDVTPSYKNHQKQKMEPNYAEETKDPKIVVNYNNYDIKAIIGVLWNNNGCYFNLRKISVRN